MFDLNAHIEYIKFALTDQFQYMKKMKERDDYLIAIRIDDFILCY